MFMLKMVQSLNMDSKWEQDLETIHKDVVEGTCEILRKFHACATQNYLLLITPGYSIGGHWVCVYAHPIML